MKEIFEIPAEAETRLWNKYMSSSYELLSNLEQTVQDAGLYQGQVQYASSVDISGRVAQISAYTHKNLAVCEVMEVMRTAYTKRGIQSQHVLNNTRQTITEGMQVLWKEGAHH